MPLEFVLRRFFYFFEHLYECCIFCLFFEFSGKIVFINSVCNISIRIAKSKIFYSGEVGEGAPFSAVLLLEKKRRLSVFCWDDGSKCLFERCVYGTI